MATETELERFQSFRNLGARSRELLRQGLVVHHTNRDAAVLHKGQPVSGAYLVLEGRLRVFTLAPSGAEATLYFVGPGEACVLALNCLFNDMLYPAWVQAECATSIAVIPGAVYRKLFESEPSIQNLTVHALSALVFRLMAELEQIHSTTHKQRLANFILTQSSAEGSLKMTQQRIAHHLGTTREVVARLLQQFVQRRYIRSRRGSIEIRDLFGLRRELVQDSSAPVSSSHRSKLR